MTDEQIKQNAHYYTYTNDHNWTWDDSGESRVDISAEISDAYIAGAHIRDEEIKELYNNLENFRSIINNLRNPWKEASVEKPPYDPDCDDETSVYVIIRQEQGNVLEAYYDYDNNDWRDREHNWRLQDPTHWMFTPEI